MSLTLLLDLDVTLLVNDINRFLPAYLQALSTELAPYANPKELVAQLMSATGNMVKNQSLEHTLKETFDGRFYPALNLKPAEVRPAIDRFYAETFPKLQSLTSPKPEAVALIQKALARGYRVVIATNPLFPRSAIVHRLTWAGLSPQDYPFELITSYETFHFAKPNPAYYAEILARLSWPDGPVVMVGDDLEGDIGAARQLGLACYWLARPEIPLPEGPLGPTASGTLSEVLSWLDQVDPANLQPDYSHPAAMLAILRATPAVLEYRCRTLTDALWTDRPMEDEWCPTEILCHLRDVEQEVNLPRIRRVLEENNPFLSGKDTDPWAQERQYICQDGPDALQKFIVARQEVLDLLQKLLPQDWQRPARHAILGPTPLSELVSIIASHDRLHIQQFQRDLELLTQRG